MLVSELIITTENARKVFYKWEHDGLQVCKQALLLLVDYFGLDTWNLHGLNATVIIQIEKRKLGNY